MTPLQAALKIALANTYVMYFKAQSYHWNVEGMFFPQFHEFFKEIYGGLLGPIDDLAERIRTLDQYAPFSLQDLLTAETIREDLMRPTTTTMMLTNLLQANQEVIGSLNEAFKQAESEDNQGIMDLIAGFLDSHAKTAWQIKSCLKQVGN